MSEIFRLGEDVANMVAAGEVVERPFNVVKELMENSADAGASHISIVVENGGVGMVRVTDNGKGILHEDIATAVQRFATSKIQTADDVYNVRTFGFRGEALAAISSVSDFSITSYRSGDRAAKLSVRHGGQPDITPAPELSGTCVEVRSLFANVPARLKFFKSFSAEEREIARFVRFFSIINPHISVELFINGKRAFAADKGADMKARCAEVFKEKDLIHGENSYEDMKISFVTSLPTVQRLRKDMIVIGVNGRVVKDPSLVQAVVNAYHRVIPDGRFPAAAVSLYVDPDKVDVNIHPAKTSVKLLNSRDIFSFVHKSVKDRLENAGREQGAEMTSEPHSPKTAVHHSVQPDTRFDRQFSAPAYDIAGEMEVVDYAGRGGAYILSMPESVVASGVRVVGQLFNTVIVCEKDGEALFIDQHVAHERVLYEKFIKQSSESVPSVLMYEPLLINVQDDELAAADESREVFEKFGYGIEPFGDSSLKIERVPTDVLNKNIETLVRGILTDLIEHRTDTDVDYRALVMSCKAAVKAGDPLEMHEMRKLVADLFKSDNPYTCPHGRPIVFRQPEEFFLRKFGR
jgi:DNA mismatch repair protein MutL